MKVLILITKSNWGGAQRYVYDLATHLNPQSFDVEVYTGSPGPLVDRLKEAGIKAEGTLAVGRDVSLREDIKAFFDLMRLLKNKKPDVLHVNSSKIGGLGALAGRLMKVPHIVFTSHGWAFNEDRTFFLKTLIRISYWIIFWLSHETIAVSDATKSQVENWPLIGKITTVHNGIESSSVFSKINARHELSKMHPTFAQALSSAPARSLIVVGSIGELHPIKGFDYALEGISLLIQKYKNQGIPKKIVYAIIGDGEKKAHIENRIKELNLGDSVFMFGHVKDAYHYMKAFDIFLVPSLSEGLPYIVLEAGLASLPTIATAVGGITEILDDMQSGILIQPRKSREIEYALDFYITHKKVQKEYGEAFHKKVMSEFNIQQMVEKTSAIYQKKY